MSDDIPFGYCHCGCGRKTTISSHTSNRYGRVKGQPVRYLSGHGKRLRAEKPPKPVKPSYEQHFWAQVNKSAPNGCWEWTAGKYASGYGIYWDGKRRIRAHRYAWELTNGPIADGLCCLHICDNRACVNPAHVFLGTKGDNARDMVAKRRSLSGERNHKAKLTREQVEEIRRLYSAGEISQQKMADRFGVSQAHISVIVRHKEWHQDSE